MSKIQRFKAFTEAAAADYVAPKDSDAEATTYTPRAKGEQDFANAHTISKTDAQPSGQDFVFDGTIKN